MGVVLEVKKMISEQKNKVDYQDKAILEKTKEKEKRIKKEKKRLTDIFKNMEEDKRKVNVKLIDNLAFMSIELEDLQKEIHKNGCVCEYQNGENQFGTKKSPEIDVYNTTFKNFASAMKQLTDMLPKSSSKEVGLDEFEQY